MKLLILSFLNLAVLPSPLAVLPSHDVPPGCLAQSRYPPRLDSMKVALVLTWLVSIRFQNRMLICKVEEIHTTLRKHLAKEEEQLLPLLVANFTHQEQAELIAQFLYSIPLSIVERFLAWLRPAVGVYLHGSVPRWVFPCMAPSRGGCFLAWLRPAVVVSLPGSVPRWVVPCMAPSRGG